MDFRKNFWKIIAQSFANNGLYFFKFCTCENRTDYSCSAVSGLHFGIWNISKSTTFLDLLTD